MDSKITYDANPCAGMSCNSEGKHLLRVIYLDKKGWFCESCKEDLLKNGLVVQEYDQKNNPINPWTAERN
jgi:hypothetical protein